MLLRRFGRKQILKIGFVQILNKRRVPTETLFEQGVFKKRIGWNCLLFRFLTGEAEQLSDLKDRQAMLAQLVLVQKTKIKRAFPFLLAFSRLTILLFELHLSFLFLKCTRVSDGEAMHSLT